ncbi:aminoglycoside phosphotransferase family protein [Curtobacterium sp. MCBA15_001]|uniref:phosphotransferase n=1 Tax=Curtobacterium sp. MCBA15_001 TaxID=1898731 RepID=UPI0008DDCF88|nr:aminoglycoside phosphotransferase family protein [Curtobacterium sp. MCBA15_001]OIH93452.1 hypothetical protein BIU90_07085 [Curtobacterium sp. MCBA15_001]
MTDAAAVRDALAASVDHTDWRIVGPLTGGRQSGAWLVEGPGGDRAVVKLATSPDWAERLSTAARSVARVRAAGYPTPAWSAVGSTPAGVGFVIQEFRHGRPTEVVDERVAVALLDVIASEAGLDPEPARCWSDFVVEQVGAGLDRLVDEARPDPGLLAACLSLAASAPLDPRRWPRTDMVHGDLRPANVLFLGDAVSGVVDIEAVGSGTRAFDHATLLTHQAISPGAVRMVVDAGVDAAGVDVFRACCAFAFLDLARFSVQAGGGADHRRTALARELTSRAVAVEQLTR